MLTWPDSMDVQISIEAKLLGRTRRVEYIMSETIRRMGIPELHPPSDQKTVNNRRYAAAKFEGA